MSRVAAPDLRPEHPLAGQTVELNPVNSNPTISDDRIAEFGFVVEDWWDRLTGGSWMNAEGNPAALIYAMRTGLATKHVPIDNQVVYGHVKGIGMLVHESELGQTRETGISIRS